MYIHLFTYIYISISLKRGKIYTKGKTVATNKFYKAKKNEQKLPHKWGESQKKGRCTHN